MEFVSSFQSQGQEKPNLSRSKQTFEKRIYQPVKCIAVSAVEFVIQFDLYLHDFLTNHAEFQKRVRDVWYAALPPRVKETLDLLLSRS